MNEPGQIPRGVDPVTPSPALQARVVYVGDFAEPAGVLMTSVIHFVPDEIDPWGLVARHMTAVTPCIGAEPSVTDVGLWGAEDPAAADGDGSRGYYRGVTRRPGGLR
jgi:hypothetical protein